MVKQYDWGTLGLRLALLIGIAALLSGCAYQTTVETADPPGFFSGLLHGLLSPYSLVAGLFSEIRVYAYPNSGWFYDFGFMTGLLPWAYSAMFRGMLSASQ